MGKEIIKKNISKLEKSKANFIRYVTKSYNRKDKKGRKFEFPESSLYFHKRVIGMVRESGDYGKLLNDKLFLEFVYATLSTWGMDRMDGGARLVKFENFQDSVLKNISLLKELSAYKMNEVDEGEIQKIKGELSILFDSLAVMEGKKLVGVSKALHHLLPDLVPPIDGRYTLNFFYGSTNYTEKNQKDKFFAIFEKFCSISRKVRLTDNDLTQRDWDTSIPKLIDNAIIGFISSERK